MHQKHPTQDVVKSKSSTAEVIAMATGESCPRRGGHVTPTGAEGSFPEEGGAESTIN